MILREKKREENVERNSFVRSLVLIYYHKTLNSRGKFYQKTLSSTLFGSNF